MVERAVPGETEWKQLSAPHLARYLAAAEIARGCRVLDAGSGAGYGAALLKQSGALSIQGVEIDRETVEQARERFGAAGVEFLVDDCERLEHVSGPFDLICCFEVIEHLQRPESFLRRAGELLAEGGVLLVSTPDRAATPPFVNGRPQNPFHVYEWHRSEFEQLLNDYFAEVELRAQVESTSLHTRMEAVDALRQGLKWNNPLVNLFWRRWPLAPKRDRAWQKLSGLAAPAISDYPIVPWVLAPAYGRPWFCFAYCRQPKCGDEIGERA